jgi:hypothetical protein
MSGEALEYGEYRMEETGQLIMRRATTPLQRAFGRHVLQCAEAAKILSRVFSDDDSPGAETEALRAILTDQKILEQVIDEAHEAGKHLAVELERVCGRVPVAVYLHANRGKAPGV